MGESCGAKNAVGTARLKQASPGSQGETAAAVHPGKQWISIQQESHYFHRAKNSNSKVFGSSFN